MPSDRQPARSARRSATMVGLVVAGVLGAGCADPNDADATDSDSRTDAETIVVSAAASLRDPLTAIAEQFESDHPGAQVRLNLASSGHLAQQLLDGAPADVAAFADSAPMDRLVRADRVASEPRVFATNGMVIVTPPGNPDEVGTLAELAEVGTLSLCVVTAPCGVFAEQLLDAADAAPDEGTVTRGRDATATLGAVSRGDADAAVVYRTDARSAGERVEVVEIDGSDGDLARYPIAEVAGSDSPALARSFIDVVLGDHGQRVLRDAGFGPPPPPTP